MKRTITIFIILLLLITFMLKDFLFGLIIKYDYNLNMPTNLIKNYYYDDYLAMLNVMNIDNIKYDYVYSKVIIRNVYDFYKERTILKGSNDGIKKDMLVINESGLVGIIDKVENNYSNVALITNPNISISVKVKDSYGILKSINNELYVTNITSEDDYENSMVYTSDLSKYLPNIDIGKVVEVTKDKSGINLMLKLESNSLSKIKYVLVLGSYD